MNLLLFLAYHHQNCLYGTFLFNCDKERKEQNFRETVSIWTDVLDNIDSFKNPYFCQNSVKIELTINFLHIKLRFWEEYFLMNNYHYMETHGNLNFHKIISIHNNL